MYFQFNLSFRDVEEMMVERGVDVPYVSDISAYVSGLDLG